MVPLSWLEMEVFFIRFSIPIMPSAVLIKCLLNKRVSDESIIFVFLISTV